MDKINKECSIKECLLQDREEEKNPDVHLGCLHMMVKSHLEYESLKIFHGLVEKYNPPVKKELGVSQ